MMAKKDNNKKGLSMCKTGLLMVLKNMAALGNNQLSIIDSQRYKTINPEGTMWISTIVKSFWKDIDFIIYLGKKDGKRSEYATVINRIILEKLIRMGTFLNKDQAKQKEILNKEFLKTCFFMFNMDTIIKSDNHIFEEYYNKFNDGSFKSIQKASINDFKAFDDNATLMKNLKLVGKNGLNYDLYRYLSEPQHGGLLYQHIKNYSSEYGRALGTSIIVCRKLLQYINDYYKMGMEEKIKELEEKSISVTEKYK